MSIFTFSSASAPKPRGNTTPASVTIALDALPVHEIEADQERPARALKHLLKANHVNYAVVYKDLQLNNYNAHNLSTAYILGGNENHLNTIYNEQIKDLEPWRPSPAEVIDEDWRDFLGDRNYQRAFVDFYEDKLAMEFAYNWKHELVSVLTAGDEPLINCLIGGFGHPLSHLALAYEIDSKELAMEGLSLTCIQYSSLHKYLNNPSYTKPSSHPASSLQDIIALLSRDERLTNSAAKYDSLESLFSQHEDIIMEYWNAWQITDATKQFKELQQTAVALLVSTNGGSFDCYMSQLLAASLAIRVLVPFTPAEYHVSLLRQWWLLAIAVCFIAGRSTPDSAAIVQATEGRSWKHVVDKALNGPFVADPHYVKAVRAMKEAADTWGDADELFLRSALTFVDGFKEWSS